MVISGEFRGIMGESKEHSDPAEAVVLEFSGNYPLRMDSAQRVAVPAKFREVLDQAFGKSGSQVVLIPDDGKVKVLPMPAWEKFKSQLESLPELDPDSDALKTFIFGNMAVCSLDAQNRIRLTPGLCDMAGLEKEVVVVGQRDKMEIWDSARWKEFNVHTSRNLRGVMTQVFKNRQSSTGR